MIAIIIFISVVLLVAYLCQIFAVIAVLSGRFSKGELASVGITKKYQLYLYLVPGYLVLLRGRKFFRNARKVLNELE